MMENSNSTSYSNNENTALNGSETYLYAVGAALAIAITILLVVGFQMKKDCATDEANLHRIEEIRERKSCPKRRKRAIYKLIETKTLTQEGKHEEHQQNMNQNSKNIIVNEDNNECPICLEKFEEGQDLSRSQKRICNHTFHAKCLEPWLMKHDDCPCCRTTFIDESTLLEDDEDGVIVVSKSGASSGRGSDENV